MERFFSALGFLSAATAVSFSYYGISFMYDDSYANKVVGGDAYNFIIYATRVTAYVCVGVVFSVLSVFFGIMALMFTGRNRPSE
jgi:hypothetical protein